MVDLTQGKNQLKLEVLLESGEIQGAVRRLGEKIQEDYRGKPLTLVGALKGCVVFMADLIRAIDLPLEIDFVELSSYGNSTNSSGEVRIIKDFSSSMAGRHVILVEDIIDTGLTLNYLMESIHLKHAESIRIAALLVKEGRHSLKHPIHYRGFDIPDLFVVGYGLDHAGLHRNLDSIAVIRE